VTTGNEPTSFITGRKYFSAAGRQEAPQERLRSIDLYNYSYIITVIFKQTTALGASNVYI